MPIQLPTVQTGFEASVDAARRKIGTVKIDVGLNSKSITDLSRPLGKITGQADQFTQSMEAANARVLAFGASVGVLSAVATGFEKIISSTIQVEKSLADINSVLGANATQLNKFKNDIFAVAKETGNSFQTVADAALEISRQGGPASEILNKLRASMILSRLSGLDAASAVEGLSAAVNSFSQTGITHEQVLNKISKTAAAFAVSERDLIEGFKRSASVAQQAGVSIDELGGIITAVQQKTSRGGAVIGNAFKTIFTRIRNPESLQALQNIGIAVTDAEDKILPATKLIELLAQKMSKLNDIQKQEVTLKIGGGFQIGPLLAALDDMTGKTNVFEEATKSMATAANEAYTRNAALNLTLAASINVATVNLQELANTLGEIGVTNSLKNILSFFNSFAEDVKNVLQGEGLGSDIAKAIVKGIGAVLSGPGLAIFGVIIAKLVLNFVQFGSAAVKTFFNIGSAAKEINNVTSALTGILLNNQSIQQRVLALDGDRVAQARLLNNIIRQNIIDSEKLASISAYAAPSVNRTLKTVGAAAGGRGSSSGYIPSSAGGYMPTVMAEANDIRKGVGGARPSDRPVVIPNFAFGGGKTGTMVAHTGEYIVPNYNGGSGSAIFNRDMVGRMGLPSDAQKIRGAGGFIPNFADVLVQKDRVAANYELLDNDQKKIIDQYRKTASTVFNKKFGATGDFSGLESGIRDAIKNKKLKATEKEVNGIIATLSKVQSERNEEVLSGTLKLNASRLGFVSVSGATGVSANAQASGFKGDERLSLDEFFGKKYESVILQGIQTRSLASLEENLNDKQKPFRQKVANRLITPILELAQDLMPGVFLNQKAIDLKSKQIRATGGGDPYLFSDALLGGVFESAVSLATGSVANMKSFNDTEKNRPFDFEETGGASVAFKEAFGFDTEASIFKAEAKKTQTTDTLNSVVGKALRDASVMKVLKSDSTAVGAQKSASGYIPNFANQEYILSTLQRIKAGTSGFSKQEQETFLKKFGATGGTGKGISLKQVFDDLDSDPSVSPFINKAYGAAGATASTSQVFKEFERQIKANPTQLRNIVKGKGYIPNFASVSKIAKDNARVASNLIQSQNTDKRLMGDDLVNLYGNNFTQINEELGDRDAQKFEDYVIKKYNYKSGLDLKYGPSAAVDGYKVNGSEIDILEVKSGAWNSYDVLNKFLRALPENYGTGNQLDLWTKGKDSFSVNASLISPINKGFKATQGKMYKNSASGFLPNFADPLNEAISREIGAGVNPSQVYVDQNNSLKGPMNPSGLMVANRRDEPSGGWQGINRARKEGANAKTYGAANGFIPNYAAQIGQVTRSDLGKTQINDQAIVGFNNSLKAISDQLRKGAISFTEANSQVNQLATVTGKTKAQINKLQASGQNLITGYNNELQARNQKAKELRSEKLKTKSSASATPDESGLEKPKKDLLGTIFAVQAGLSLLTGATEESKNEFLKYTNIVSDGLGTATSAKFAFEGLANIAPKFAGFLGPAGTALGVLTAAWQVGTAIYNEQSGINKTVAQALDRVGKAASEASTNLEKLSPEGKKKVEEQAKASVLNSLKTGRTIIAKGVPTYGNFSGQDQNRIEEVARFDKDVSDKLRDSLFKIQAEALGAGVSVDDLNKEIQKFSNDTVITQDEIKKLSFSFAGFIDEIKKGEIELKKLNLNPNEGPGATIGAMSRQDVEKYLNPKLVTLEDKANTAGYKTVEEYKGALGNFTEEAKAKREKQTTALDFLKKGITASGKTEGSEAFNATLLAQAQILIDGFQKKQGDLIENTQALNIEYEKTLQILKSEENLRALNLKIDDQISGKKGAKLEAERQLLEVSRDLNLSDVERANKIEDINKALDNQLKKLEFQRSSAKDLQGTFSKLFTSIGILPEEAGKKANDLFNKINNSSSEVKLKLGKELSEGQPGSLDEYLDNLKVAEIEAEAVKSTLAEWFKNLALSTDELQRQEGYDQSLLDLVRDRLALEKTNTDNLAKRNELLQNSIQLNQQLKDLQIKEFTPEEFSKRKQVVELGRPKLNETSLDALKREAQKAQSERDLQPIDQSRAVQDIQQRSLRDAIQQATALATKDAETPIQIANLTEKISKTTDLEELRGPYGEKFNENLDKIIEKRNTEISQLKENNDLQKEGLSLAEQKLQAIQSGVFGGLESGLAKLREENEMFAFNLGERIPSLFADNMAAAMEAVIVKGEDLGDSLRSAASSFLSEITKANIKNLANQFTTGAGTLFRAKGGPITGGSGSKDDVPAMLMGGEYVMNKRAVSKYGTGFMEALNNGSISGYAKGGSVIRGRGLGSDVVSNSDSLRQTGEGGFQMPGYYGSGAITGKKDLLSYASQAYTSGAGDIIGGGDNSAYIDLTPESVRLTNFGRKQGPMAAAVKESKQEALGLYFQQLAAEKQAKEEEKAQKKAFKRAIITALITSAAGAVIGAGASGFKAGVMGAGKDANFGQMLMAGGKGIFTGGDIGGGVMAGGLKNLFTGNYQLSQISDLKGYSQYLNKNPEEISKFLAGSASRSITGAGGGTLNAWSGDGLGPDGLPSLSTPFDSGLLNGPDGSLLPPIWNPTDPIRGDVPPFVPRATGGRIPQTAGIDTVPAMLSGGEFIMNAGATQRIGASNLNAMNSGASTETSSSAINDQLISKLDELIKITKESSKPVTVNVSSQQGQTGGDKQGEENKSEKDQNLSRKIKAAVIAVLQEEKRLGGVLRRS